MAKPAVEVAPTPDSAGATATLAALHARAFDRPWSAEDIEATRRSPGGLLLQADPGPGGFILLRIIVDEAEVLALAVEPSARRAGIGSALIDAALDQAAGAGAGSVWLEVAEDNAAARALYASAGFVEDGRRRAYYARPDGAVDALVLRRRLNRA